MKDESEVMFGPWWIVVLSLIGTAGWLMVYRLWTSTSKKELDKMTAKLAEANATIDRLSGLELKWRNRADELSTELKTMHDECKELRSNFKLLKIAFDKNGETIARLAQDLKEERELRDQQFMQWTREKAARGEL
jgi:septal ring factor EnvC (AmiA/AmiB activator)